jgi:hypothetical protein
LLKHFGVILKWDLHWHWHWQWQKWHWKNWHIKDKTVEILILIFVSFGAKLWGHTKMALTLALLSAMTKVALDKVALAFVKDKVVKQLRFFNFCIFGWKTLGYTKVSFTQSVLLAMAKMAVAKWYLLWSRIKSKTVDILLLFSDFFLC